MTDQDRLAALLHEPCADRWRHRGKVGYGVDTMHDVDAHHPLAARLLAAGVTLTQPQPGADCSGHVIGACGCTCHRGLSLDEARAALPSTPAAPLDAERLAAAIHLWHNPGTVTPCRAGSSCRRDAANIAREYAALAPKEANRG